MSKRAASTWLGIAFALVGSAAIAFSVDGTGDYSSQVAPAVRALAGGDLAGFFDLQPVYGSFSVLVQAPFAALALHVGDGSDLLLYRLALLPCLLAVGLLGTYLARVMAERGQKPVACAVACGFALLNPGTFAAVDNGHPEELLAATLVIGAVLMGLRGHRFRAALLLGLALSTKQWALLGVLPVLLASQPGSRIRIALSAVVVAAVLTLPLLVSNSERFANNNRAAQGATPNASRFSVWWRLASQETLVVRVGEETSTVVRHRLPRRVTGTFRPLIVLAGLALALLFARRGGRGEDILGLLALILLVRCVLDPLNNPYYHVSILLSLLAWEGLRIAGLPALTLLSAVALWATFENFLLVHPGLNNAFYLGWTLALAAWLSLSLYAPGLRDGLRSRLSLRGRVALPVARSSLHARQA